MQIIYNYDKENNKAQCIIKDKEIKFVKEAYCHPDDIDFCSEKTGNTIAAFRASIAQLQHERDNVIKPALKVVKHLYGCLAAGKNFSPTNHETAMVKRELDRLEDELTAVNFSIKELKIQLKKYINDKDKFYQKIRKERSK